MIWSFVKIALFLVAVAALTMGATYLAESGEGVRLILLGKEFTLGPLQAVIVALLTFVAVWVLLKAVGLIVAFLRFLNGDETAISRYFDRNRERKGYEALAEGLMAVASGEGRLALSKAARAERFLQRPELTNLLTAQAAEVAGDTKMATAVYKRLLGDERTRFVGVRGLMKQKLAEGDTDTALKLAEKAYALKPKHQEVQDTLLKLQAEKGDWKGARDVLSTKLRQGLLPKDVHKRRDAVLALQEAKGVLDEGATVEAREAAIAANKSSPDLIPAAVMAARAYIAKGNAKHAARVLHKAWEAQPHPDLAAAYAEIAPDESPAQRLKRFEKLLALRPDHEETRLLQAELNIAAEDFPAARRALGDLAEVHPTARVLTIMAAVERGEGADDAVVRGWLTRALSAPRGPQWCCDKCQNIQAEWSPVCDNCGGFDTLSWREPVQGAVPLPHGAEMLPLIVGQPTTADEHDDPVDIESIVDADLILDAETRDGKTP
ncbi:heme biosynthesis HemY N-terminal domain-containing protein [Paenirhodobacter sp. CAU 1674]|uniref:heme biosynthesis protein HemY n=1 Tax=Paenirhodobacter sp. CAU 1674 TaxID=3032596 RepID=UPI0023DB8040|nr:heme biosynthesis HemY N-terminal domain-containing protein [Paenirhodobacter sp. CAU 1674]MDF2142000.1 heme biosynthesis HemY N-terminal domain-containing protein [Paenirhodobacter sp. CAU 1674]